MGLMSDRINKPNLIRALKSKILKQPFHLGNKLHVKAKKSFRFIGSSSAHVFILLLVRFKNP